MFKKLLTLTVVIILLLVPGCKKTPDYAYVNENYGYTFCPPKYWEGNYYISYIKDVDYCTLINFKSEIDTEYWGQDSGPGLIDIYAITQEQYEKWSDEPDEFSGYGPYIKHPSKDLGLWVVYPDGDVIGDEWEIYKKLFDDVYGDKLTDYLYFNDTK